MRPPTGREIVAQARALGLPLRAHGGDLVIVLPGVASVRIAWGSGANRQVGREVAHRFASIVGQTVGPYQKKG